MLDSALRRVLDRPLTLVAIGLNRPWITPDRVTVAGLVLRLGSAAASAVQLWWMALALWLMSRLFDGLDGSLARLRQAGGEVHDSAEGGFLDITADFAVYSATVLGVGIGATSGFSAPWWPFALVLATYCVNGTTFLAFSSIAERTGRQIEDGRSLSFLGRIAEGTETIVVHGLWLIVPFLAWQIAVLWSLFVAASAVQRMIIGYRVLKRAI